MLRFALISIMLFSYFATYAHDKILVGGEIKDEFLGIPLADAKIMLLNSDSIEIKKVDVLKIQNRNGRIEHAQFYTSVDRGQKYIIRAAMEGYETAFLNFEITDKAPSQMFVGDILLQKKIAKLLDDVVVTATKIKMTWKGDTLVYNADAFNMPKGSMLDDLIRQMPGVRMNDHGEIFVNGRKVDELLLGSKSFFRGKSEVILKNLPYYTVKNVKVYDKSSELSESLGYDVGSKKFVMDVNLKQEYNSGMLANVEVAAGTSSRYLGRAFLLGFSDPFRFSLVANLNNVNESRHIGQSNSWRPEKMPISMLTTQSVAGEMNYDNKKVEETFNIEYTYDSNSLETQRRTEYFIGLTPPVSVFQSNSIDKNHILKIHNNFKLLKPFTTLKCELKHRSLGSRSTSSDRHFDDGNLTNSLSNLGFGNGNVWEFKANVSGNFSINRAKKSYLNYTLEFNRYEERKADHKKYDFLEPVAPTLYNINKFHNRQSKSLIWLTYSTSVWHDVSFSIEEQISLENGHKDDYLFHPDTLILPSQQDALLAITDFSNSYRSNHIKNTYTTLVRVFKNSMLMPSDNMPYPMDFRAWELSMAVAPVHQSLHYRRGKLDTIPVSDVLMFQPTFKFTIYPNNSYDKSVDFIARHTMAPPSLYDRIDYKDDSQPLIVKLGNPHLKGNQSSTISANFHSRGRYGNLLHTGAVFDFMHRATAQSVIYEPQSGIYTYKPVNVKGNYIATLNVDITRTFDKRRAWTLNNNADASFNHNVDQTMLHGETESVLNKVNTLTLHDGAYVQYERNGLNLRATGDVRWRHSTGNIVDFKKLNALDFQYGMSARYTIPLLNMTVSADGTMFSRRGYGSSLNTNDFVLNASVTQPILKGKIIARLECFDLFHQLSRIQYEVNAQGRTETWHRSLPHYVMLHLSYQFNINTNKK